jgi:Zn-dependent protease
LARASRYNGLMTELNLIQKIAIYALPLLFAITVHEAAHGYAARRLGDRTAEMLGRLTLNPIKHIDPMGTLLVPMLLLMSGTGFIFGWAKPVPVSPRNFKNPGKDMAIVAAAGPASNLVMALFWAVIMRLVAGPLSGIGNLAEPIFLMAQFGLVINALLAVLNMLPIPPLDGGRVAVGLLPPKASMGLAQVEPYGMWILVGLMVTGLLSPILWPSISLVTRLITTLVGF